MLERQTVEQWDAALQTARDADLKLYANDFPESWRDPSVSRLNKAWDALTPQEQRAIRSENEISRRRWQARLDATAAEKAKQEQQEREQQFQKLLDEYRQERRATFAGTDAQFESVWPHLEREWLIGQATGQSAVDRERLRLLKSHDYSF